MFKVFNVMVSKFLLLSIGMMMMMMMTSSVSANTADEVRGNIQTRIPIGPPIIPILVDGPQPCAQPCFGVRKSASTRDFETDHVIDTVDNAVDVAQEVYGIVMRLFETVNGRDVLKLVKCTASSLPLYVIKDVIDSLGGPWAILFGDAMENINEQKVQEIIRILGLERVGKLVECAADIAPKVIAALTPEAQDYLTNLAQQYLPNFVIEDFEDALNRSFRRNFVQLVQNKVEDVKDWVSEIFNTVKRVFKALSFKDLVKLFKCTSKAVNLDMVKAVIDTLGGVWNIVFKNALSKVTFSQIREIVQIIGAPVMHQFIDCAADLAPKVIDALGPEATSFLSNLANNLLPSDVIDHFNQAVNQQGN